MSTQKNLLLILSFIVGALTASLFGWLQPVAAIEVKTLEVSPSSGLISTIEV